MIHVTLSPQILCLLSRTGVSILQLPTHSTPTLEESKRVIPPRWILNEWSCHVYWHRSYYEWVIADLWSMWVYHLISYVFYWGTVCQFCDCPLIVWRLSKDQNKWSRPVEFWMSDPATLNSDWVIPPRVLTPVILWVGNRRFLIHVTLSPHISCLLSRTGVSILRLPTHGTMTLNSD